MLECIFKAYYYYYSWKFLLYVWQLGLAEKNILNCDFDLVASDPSDANTNSTTLFSDDTDDKSRKSTNPELASATHQENEVSSGFLKLDTWQVNNKMLVTM